MTADEDVLPGQLTLDEALGLGQEAHARRADPSTSHEAARSVRGDAMTAVQSRILSMAYRRGTFTDESIAAWWEHNARDLKVSPSGLRSRRAELVAAGLLEDSGHRGRTAMGRACIVWRVTKAGERRAVNLS